MEESLGSHYRDIKGKGKIGPRDGLSMSVSLDQRGKESGLGGVSIENARRERNVAEYQR
jgi:hypothetical protein